MVRKWRTRIYVSSFDLLFVLLLSDLHPFGNEARKIGRHTSFSVMESCNRRDTDMSMTNTVDSTASRLGLEAIDLVRICIVSLVGFPCGWSAYPPIHDSSGCFFILIFASILLCITRLLCSLIFHLPSCAIEFRYTRDTRMFALYLF